MFKRSTGVKANTFSMANTCVTIPDDKIDILKRYIGRIEKDFGVKANIQNENTSRDGGDARNSTWVLGLTGKSVSELEAAKVRPALLCVPVK